MSACRCTSCFWTGSRKHEEPDNTPLPRPCPCCEEATVVAGGPPPTSTETTPSGFEIAFWDKVNIESGQEQQRRYKVNGERFTSVTTITGILDKSDFLIPWAVRLERAGEDWREVKELAGKRGDAAHEVALAVVTGEVRRLSDMEEAHRPYGQAAMLWVSSRRPKVIQAEYMVASVKHAYTGRSDLFALIDDYKVRVDYKSVEEWKYDKAGNLYDPYPENALQLDLYEGAAVESGFEAADYGMVVRLGPDGEYVETPFALNPERGLKILGAYRARSEAKKALAADFAPPPQLQVAA